MYKDNKKKIVLSSRRKDIFINKLETGQITDLEFYKHVNIGGSYIKCYFRDTDNNTYYYRPCNTPYIHWKDRKTYERLEVDNSIWKIIDSTMSIAQKDDYTICWTKK